MGYYVTSDGTVQIKADKLEEAFKDLQMLNVRDDLKTGGSSGYARKPFNSKSVASDPSKWFSWMEWNYDEICESAEEVFKELGFQTDYADNGDLLIFGYDNKVGAEKHFVEVIAEYVTEDSEMVWTGEDGEKWRWVFEDGDMIEQEAKITWK